MDRLDGKIAIVTGATSGIGLAAAVGLARLGAEVKLVGRDPDRLKEAQRQVAGAAGHTPTGYLADISSMAEVRRLAQAILADTPRLDILLLNAGMIFDKREESVDGIEKTFALNHLSPFLLTHLLRDRLIGSAPARVIVTASTAHRFAKATGLAEAAHPKKAGISAYGVSKLANILFAKELAQRLAGTGVTAFSFHPGVVATRFATGAGLFGFFLQAFRPFLRTPEHGAETALYLASSPEVLRQNGGYFADCRPSKSSATAESNAAARSLWAQSESLCGIAQKI